MYTYISWVVPSPQGLLYVVWIYSMRAVYLFTLFCYTSFTQNTENFKTISATASFLRRTVLSEEFLTPVGAELIPLF
jgi:hypothetical protein